MISGKVLIILDGTITALIIGALETGGVGTTASIMVGVGIMVSIMVSIMVGAGIMDSIIGDTILFGTHIKII